MKRLKTIFAAILFATANCLLPTANLFSQCIPDIKIDGNSVIADENHPYGVKLPSWLRAGQTLERGNNVFSVSVIEFTVNGTALDYSQNLSITTPVQTVPANKIWKIESVHKNAQFTPTVVATYSTAGAYTFNPGCSGYYKIQVWGGGGGGGSGDGNCYCRTGGGGGGAGYTEATFFLSSGTPYSGTVGAGGTGGPPNYNSGSTGGTSIFNGPSSISATGGGGGGGSPCNNVSGSGGSGGTGSGGQANVTGQAGQTGPNVCGSGGSGGTGANGGGAGGTGVYNAPGNPGVAPGGGGGATGYCCTYTAGNGAVGRVVISLGGGTISSSRVPCTNLYIYNSGGCGSVASCPTGWNDAGCGMFDGAATGGTVTYCRTCYRCD